MVDSAFGVALGFSHHSYGVGNARAGVRIVRKKTLEQPIAKFTLAILVGARTPTHTQSFLPNGIGSGRKRLGYSRTRSSWGVSYRCWPPQRCLPNQQRTHNKLTTKLRCRNFVTQHRLSLQIGAKCAKTCMECVVQYIPTQLLFWIPPLVVGSVVSPRHFEAKNCRSSLNYV